MKIINKKILLMVIAFCIFGITNVNAKTVCKRATKLHKEQCTIGGFCSTKGDYQKGQDIVYGNYGTSTSLATGDAFDCDVNGDGVFNPYKERFYYITNLSSNNAYAVLLYYINTYNGQPSPKQGTYYHNKDMHAAYGPETAKTHLPTASAWNNVALASTTRDILYDTGTVALSNFSYDGYSSRLLNKQELVAANCTSDSSNSNVCKFLAENTAYRRYLDYKAGYWLENQYYIAQTYVGYRFDSQGFSVYMSAPNTDYYGTRPAIEVKLDEIDTTLREHEENIYADQEQDTNKDSTNSNNREEEVTVPDTSKDVSKIVLINAIICILIGITIISLNTVHKKKNKS